MNDIDRDYIHGATNADTDWEKEHLFCGRGCVVRSVVIANKGPACWAWICDSPTAGAQKPTQAPVYVPGNSTVALDWSNSPHRFKLGLYVCATSDPVTKTLIGGNDAFFEVSYALES